MKCFHGSQQNKLAYYKQFIFNKLYINAAYDRYKITNMVMDVKSNNKGLSEENDKNKKIIKELENTANNQALFFQNNNKYFRKKKQLEEILQKFVFFN